MVFSELIIKMPYKILSWFNRKIMKNNSVYFYVDSLMDYVIFKNIHKYIPEVKLVAKNREVKAELETMGLQADTYPVFPDALIMCRHSHHMFPDNKIITIGLRHGVYHFKDFIHPSKYNRFDLFLFTSQDEVMQAKKIGIHTGINAGFPKLDDLFKNENKITAQNFRKELFDNDKPLVLFSATWDKSGLSAIDKWYEKLNLLTDKYNVMVTVHPWVSKKYTEIIRNTSKVFFIDEKVLTKYLLAADVLIADTSSIIGEFSILNKPVITFKIKKKLRLPQDIVNMLDDMTYRINNFDELIVMLDYVSVHPDELSDKRKKYNKIMIDHPPGNHGEKAANIINKYLISKNINPK